MLYEVITHFLVEVLHGTQGKESVEQGEDRGEGEFFLLGHQVALAQDADERARGVGHGKTVVSLVQKQPDRLGDVRIRSDGSYNFV